jgi:hypothetical protein
MIRAFRAASATLVLAALLLAALLAANLWTFDRLNEEQSVASLYFSKLAEDVYEVELVTSGEPARQFILRGDDWQLDARMITWSSWLFLAGRDPLYRLDRLSGRFRAIERARNERPSMFALSENPGLDLWALAKDGMVWLPGVDAAYGSAVFLPMQDNAGYEIFLTQKGIIARPTNEHARAAISQWY